MTRIQNSESLCQSRKVRYWTRKKLGIFLAGLLLLALAFLAPPLPPAYRDLTANASLHLTDRFGQPLRSLPSARQGVDQAVAIKQMPFHLLNAVIISEDKRFAWHPGIDPVAILRATLTNLKAGHVISGASTLTQQLLRTLKASPERSLTAKIGEAYWAVRLEFHYSKQQILEAYLNRIAFGPTIYGAEEAARAYFDKPASSLSLAECAALAVMIRSPVALDPWSPSGRQALPSLVMQLLSRMEDQGVASAEDVRLARIETTQGLTLSDRPAPFEAPHFCSLVLPQLVGLRGSIATSLDLKLQHQVEGLVSNHLKLLSGHAATNAAVIVADVKSGEVLALVGSASFQRKQDGQVNAAVALRQPGSTLKPITYALLLENVGQTGIILPDLPIYSSSHQAGYIPENYDNRFHGPVSLRTALACSLNVPAVRAQELIGTDRLLTTLRALGLNDLTGSPDHYGLGLTLGSGSASLWQLVGAYRTLAREGLSSPLTLLLDSNSASTRVLSAASCQMITDVLSDNLARLPAFGRPNPLELPFPVAAKTGTSKGYRDNWCLGYTPRHVVGVWVGNSDGSPMHRASGITGAGPLFHDVMLALGDGGDFLTTELHPLKVCALSGNLATLNCPRSHMEWSSSHVLSTTCTVCHKVTEHGHTCTAYALSSIYQPWAQNHGLKLASKASLTPSRSELHFVYPLQNDVFLLDADLTRSHQRLRLQIAGGVPPFTWQVDGTPLAHGSSPQVWWPLTVGQHTVTIMDTKGSRDSITLTVRGPNPDHKSNVSLKAVK